MLVYENKLICQIEKSSLETLIKNTWGTLVWEDPTCRGATRPVSHNY